MIPGPVEDDTTKSSEASPGPLEIEGQLSTPDGLTDFAMLLAPFDFDTIPSDASLDLVIARIRSLLPGIHGAGPSTADPLPKIQFDACAALGESLHSPDIKVKLPLPGPFDLWMASAKSLTLAEQRKRREQQKAIFQKSQHGLHFDQYDSIDTFTSCVHLTANFFEEPIDKHITNLRVLEEMQSTKPVEFKRRATADSPSREQLCQCAFCKQKGSHWDNSASVAADLLRKSWLRREICKNGFIDPISRRRPRTYTSVRNMVDETSCQSKLSRLTPLTISESDRSTYIP